MNKSYQILDAMELPTSSRSGNSGSKYFPAEMQEAVSQLQPKQGFYVPLLEPYSEENPKPTANQRYGIAKNLAEWAAKQARPANGEHAAVPAPKFTVCIVLPAKDDEGKVVREGAIAIRREK